MKILQIISFFSLQKGGSVNNVYNLTKYLILKGHEVTIFTSDNEYDEKMANSLRPAIVVPFRSYFGGWYYTPSMRKALDENIANYDIVHLNNYWSYQNIIVAHFAAKHGVPFVLSPHGSLPIIMRGYGRKFLFNLFFGESILKKASKIIAVSEMEHKQILKKKVPKEKVMVIPNAVDLSMKLSYKKGGFRKKYNISDDEKVILFLGRIHPIKGVDLLLRAFADLVRAGMNLRLVIAGPDDGFLNYVQKLVKCFKLEDKVIFTGPLYDENKYSAFSDSDIYVLPSKYEIFAITILEACLCGVPVIITDRHGIANYIRGKVGEVVPYNWRALSLAIKKLLSDDDLRKKYGQAAIKLVEDNFAWDKIIGIYEKAYKEVIEKGRNRDTSFIH